MIAGIGLSAYLMNVPSFGENVRAARERQNLTQEQVAERLGLKRPTPVSLLEGYRGARVPRPVTIRKVADALGVEPWKLLEGVVTEIDQLRKPSDLLRQGGMAESSKGDDHGKSADSAIGTEHAPSEPIPSRKAPDVEARLREEVESLRVGIERVSAALVALGTPEASQGHTVAAKKPRRRSGSRKGA